jgi:4-hydroxy-tetrahydrodipicolinate synthase
MVTPFRPDERVDFSAWQKIIDHLIANGASGLLAAGGQGEFFSLDEEERVVVLRFCKQYVAGRVPVYGNVGCISTRDTVRLAEKAEVEGIDYAVVVTPYYLRPSAEELRDHYAEVCRAVRIPVLAYNVPERTGVELTPLIVRHLAHRFENFVGIKDSSGKLDAIPELVAIGQEKPFSVMIGRDHLILEALKLGCAGAVASCANVVPRLFADLFRAFEEGRMEEAARLQGLADPLRHSFALHTFPAVIKEAMDMIGYPAGHCRRPVGPMPAAARRKLAEVLETLREAGYLSAAEASLPQAG